MSGPTRRIRMLDTSVPLTLEAVRELAESVTDELLQRGLKTHAQASLELSSLARREYGTSIAAAWPWTCSHYVIPDDIQLEDKLSSRNNRVRIRIDKRCGHGRIEGHPRDLFRPDNGTVVVCPLCYAVDAYRRSLLIVGPSHLRHEFAADDNLALGHTLWNTTVASSSKVHWHCMNPACRRDHPYEAIVSNRTKNGSGCPDCAQSRTVSRPAATIIAELENCGIEVTVEPRYPAPGRKWRADASFDAGERTTVLLEVDGPHHAKPRVRATDESKNEWASGTKGEERRYIVVRVRLGPELEALGPSDVIWHIDDSELDVVKRVTAALADLAVYPFLRARLQEYSERTCLANPERARQLLVPGLIRHPGEVSIRDAACNAKTAEDFNRANEASGIDAGVVRANSTATVRFRCGRCGLPYRRPIEEAVRLKGDPCPTCNPRITPPAEECIANANPELRDAVLKATLLGHNPHLELADIDVLRVGSATPLAIVCKHGLVVQLSELRVQAERGAAWCSCERRRVGDIPSLRLLTLGSPDEPVGGGGSKIRKGLYRCSGEAGLQPRSPKCVGVAGLRSHHNVRTQYELDGSLPTCSYCRAYRIATRPR